MEPKSLIRNRALDIQVLRGISIIFVVSYHLDSDIFTWGYIGVDIFFVISGWLLAPRIASILKCKKMSSYQKALLKKYLLARFRRTYPALITSILVTLPIVTLGLNVGSDLSRSIKQALLGIVHLSNISASTLAGDYFSPNPNAYLHLWSLSAELQIYVIVPLMILLLHTLLSKIGLSKIETPVLFFILLIFSLFTANLLWDSYFSTFFRATEFLMGAISRSLAVKMNKNSYSQIRLNSWAFMSSITSWSALSIFLINEERLYWQLSVVSASSIALFLSQLFEISQKIDSRRNIVLGLLAWFGSISFPLYLVHLPILVTVKHSTLAIYSFSTNRVIISSIALILSIFAAWLIHEYFEYPERQKLATRLLIRNVVVSLLLGITLLFCNANRFFGLNHHNEKPSKVGDKRFLGCDLNVVREEPCIFGDEKSDSRVALIGDSHAVVLAEIMVKKLTPRFRVETWVGSGCKYYDPKIVDEFVDSRMSLGDACFLRNRNFRAELASGAYDHIFVSWRSQDCDINEFMGLCESPFNKLMIKSVSQFSKYTKSFWILGPNLELKRDIDFFWDRSLFGDFTNPVGIYSIKQLENQPFRDLQEIRESGLPYLSPIESMCDASRCRVLSKGNFLLADSNHLSRIGAEEIFHNVDKLVVFGR